MAATKITDLIVPEIWLPYMQELTATKSNLIQSGIVDRDPEYASLASGGGATVNMPFFQDLTGNSEVLSESGALSVNSIGAATDVSVILRRGKAWGTGQLARFKSGADPAGAIADLVAQFWVRDMQDTLISLLRGIFASTTMANEHVSDVSIADGNSAAAANLISSGATLDALKLLGDEIDAITGMAIHSDIYYELEKQDVIEYLAPSEQNAQPIRTYKGRTLIIDDRLPKVAGGISGFVYSTYLFGPGAIALGEGDIGADEAVKMDEDILAGEEYLAHRRQCIMHPKGVRFTSSSVAGDSPTNAELATGANWNRVWEKKNVRLIQLLTNGCYVRVSRVQGLHPLSALRYSPRSAMLYTRKYPNLRTPKNKSPQSVEPEAIAADSEPKNQSPLPAALVLCNNADAPSDLRPIPTVGTGAGKVILRERPEGGYGDLSELPAVIFAPPYNCDLDEIAAWEG